MESIITHDALKSNYYFGLQSFRCPIHSKVNLADLCREDTFILKLALEITLNKDAALYF